MVADVSNVQLQHLGKPSKILMPPPSPLLTFEGGRGVPPKSQLSPKRLDFLLKLYSWSHSKVILKTCRLQKAILKHYTIKTGHFWHKFGWGVPVLCWLLWSHCCKLRVSPPPRAYILALGMHEPSKQKIFTPPQIFYENGGRGSISFLEDFP